MTQPAPSYQQYQPLSPMMGTGAPPNPSSGGLTSLIAGILALVVAGLTVGGSFAPITSFRNTYEGGDATTVYGNQFGWWGFSDNGSTTPIDEDAGLYGLALVLVAALLVLGAVFAFVASRTRSASSTTGARSLITAGVGVLTGAMLLQSLQVLEQASSYDDRELDAGESVEFSAGLGLVLPLAALALGVVAVVLSHVGQRQRVELSTPRMGFPAPYGYQQLTTPPAVPTTAGTPAAPAKPDEDDADTTQVLSNAIATGQDSGPGTASGVSAPVTPPAPVAGPHATGVPESNPATGPTVAAGDPAPAGPAPVTPPPPVTPPSTQPRTGGTPTSAGPGDQPPASPPATTSAAPAASAPSVPAEPTPTGTGDEAAEPPAPEAPEAAAKPAEPAPLSDLPPAPEAPELSNEKNEK